MTWPDPKQIVAWWPDSVSDSSIFSLWWVVSSWMEQFRKLQLVQLVFWYIVYTGLELSGGGFSMSTDAHFWVKIGFKFQSLGKMSNISTSDPQFFRSIPTLCVHNWYHCFFEWRPNTRCIKNSGMYIIHVFWKSNDCDAAVYRCVVRELCFALLWCVFYTDIDTWHFRCHWSGASVWRVHYTTCHSVRVTHMCSRHSAGVRCHLCFPAFRSLWWIFFLSRPIKVGLYVCLPSMWMQFGM